MSALAKRRPDYRNATAQAVKARVHDELRANVRLVQIADFERDMEGFHAYA